MSDIQVNEPNPWQAYQDPILSSDKLSDPETIRQIAGMDGVRPNSLIDGRKNFSSDEIAERAEKASKSEQELSPSEKAMVEEFRYAATGAYRRKYF